MENYEERYNKLVNFIKDLYPHTSDYVKEKLEGFSPELRESEDERIRKELIAWLERKQLIPTETKNEWIAWLEKQGEKSEYNPYKATVESIAEMCKSYSTLTDLHDFYYNVRVKCKDAMEYDKTWTEKQGEQKPANESELKFKVGDWIIDVQGISACQIIGYEDDSYLIKAFCSQFYLPMKITEKNYRLWEIQDAKDGDVLYHKSSLTGIEYIVMSRGVNGCGNIDSYFRYNSEDGFGINIPSVLSGKLDDVTPATKEQRDLLFQKMKEAGYEWDVEKKELKKAESKSAVWSEERLL